MLVKTTLRELDFDQAMAEFDAGAALVDFRNVDEYLEVHVPGSLCLGYESGPGMNTRARDCIPLSTPLVLLDLAGIDMLQAAAALRGKGFTVVGSTRDAVNAWVSSGGKPGSTEIATGNRPPQGRVLDVADPGARPPAGAERVSIERLWRQVEDFSSERRVVIVAGAGVRAALAVGMLERVGVPEVTFWKTGTPRRGA